MKKLIIIVLSFVFITGVFPFAASAVDTTCKTKYPIVLAHGMLATDKMLGFINYWYGISPYLTNKGAQVYTAKINCLDTTVNKADAFKTQYLQFLALTGAEKGNIIAHSHGTLYTRTAISNLGLAPKVASYTSLGGAHKGSKLADLLINGLTPAQQTAMAGILDWVYGAILGDTNPQSLQNGIDVTTNYVVNTFNPNTPNIAGVYYQSWAFKIIQPLDLLFPAWTIIVAMGGGDNDGIVSVDSQKWGTFRGTTTGWLGINHLNEINHLFGATPGFDAKGFYANVASDLKTKGY
jgi:triacylglycerol lipase